MDSKLAESIPPVSSETIGFVSLGMIVLDDLRYTNGKVRYDVAGGSGLYSTLGARMAIAGVRNAQPQKVGCLIFAGNDFPDHVVETIKEWETTLVVRKDPTKLSTRGLVQYVKRGDLEDRIFEYTTTPLQPAPSHLAGSPLLRSTAFHFLAAPEKLTEFVSELFTLRDADQPLPRPLIVWEPAPFSCVSASRNAHLKTARLVDVYSPNHTELLATFASSSQSRSSTVTHVFDRKAIEVEVSVILLSGVGKDGNGTVVVRCAEHGCLVASRSYPAKWFPAYYGSTSSQVVDPTGAGNSFLGALTIGLSEGTSIVEAVIMGTVAASFAIEQIGLPAKGFLGPSETWNGEGFLARVEKYQAMLS